MKNLITMAAIVASFAMIGCSTPLSSNEDSKVSKVLTSVKIATLDAVINDDAKTGAVTLPENVDKSHVLVVATLAAGATAKIGNTNLPAEGLTVDVSSGIQLSVTAKDSTAPVVYSITVTGGSSAAADTVAPSNVTTLSAIGGDGKLTLSWIQSTEIDFTKVEISGDNGFITIEVLKDTLTKEVTGLTNGTTYNIVVKSVDATGNKSTGATVSGTPTATPVSATLHVASGSPLTLGADGTIKVNTSLSGKGFTKTGGGKLNGTISSDGSLVDSAEGNVKASLGQTQTYTVWVHDGVHAFWADGTQAVGISDTFDIKVAADGLITVQYYQDSANGRIPVGSLK